jgi:hypothetical protein
MIPNFAPLVGRPVLRWLAWLCCAVACWGAALPALAEPAVVGRIALAVGVIHRIAADGQRVPVKSGDALRERDRIVTGSDALAMIVFSDQGRLALRPDTDVLIKAYRVDPSGADTQLDLELLRGTVRQISGKAAQLQPERYRLNTPIAAIGVRGTDFLVNAEAGTVRTYVHEGTIVIQPPANDCPRLAACPIWAASNAGDAGALLQIQAGGQIRRFNAGSDEVERIFGVRVASALTGLSRPTAAASAAGSAGEGVPPSAGSTPSVGAANASTALQQGQNDNGLSSFARAASLNAVVSQANAVVISAAIGGAASGTSSGASTGSTTTNTTTAAAPLVPQGLVWAAAAVPSTGALSSAAFPMLVPASQVPANRQVTVGELGLYNLWREVGNAQAFASLSGRVSFGLASGQAVYLPSGGAAVAAELSQGRLDVNFDAATFSTALRLGGGAVPVAQLAVSGQVTSNGFILGRSADAQQSVAGALTFDGREAGYSFTVAGGAGSYQGITLWGLAPGAAGPSTVASTPVSTTPVGLPTGPAVAAALVPQLLPLPTQLVWGRSSFAPAASPYTLALGYEQAAAGRQVTVGELGEYALWRSIGSAGLATGLKGDFSFGLSAVQAFYTATGGSAQVATVQEASLNANFNTAVFTTRLVMGGGAVPVATLEASGRINDEGVFTSRNADGSQYVAGAFTVNAQEAGYLFRMATKGGQYQGITLWGRKP